MSRCRVSMLLGLAGASYATSFLRERFLLREALGDPSLDRAVLLLSVGYLCSNLLGAFVATLWITGRWKRPAGGVLVGAGSVLIVLAALWPSVGVVAVIVAGYVAYEVNRQRAAFQGRQAVALTGAVTAVIPAVAGWQILGTAGGVLPILAGYALGAVWQAAFATLAATGSRPSQLPQTSRRLLWPLAYIASTQVNGMTDRFLLLGTGPGMVASATFGYNMADAAVLVMAGPLAAEAVAGRLSTRRLRGLLSLTAAATVAYVVLAPPFLRFALQGDAASGADFANLLYFALVYGAGIAAATVLLFSTRTMLGQQHAWRFAAGVTGLVLVVHVAVSSGFRLLNEPRLVPVGWLVAVCLGALVAAARLRSTHLGSSHRVRDEKAEEPDVGSAEGGHGSDAQLRDAVRP